MKITQGGVLIALSKGARLMKTIVNHPPEKAGVFFQLIPGGKVERELVDRMLSDGLLKPTGDDLFDADQCQTYERATNL